jgi:hypothetical protein
MAAFRDYSKDVLDIFSYCLLRNHFHSLVYTKDVMVQRHDGHGTIKLLPSKQLGHFFNSYAQAFNREYDRTGSLFEKPFKRKPVELNHYLKTMVMYIHTNPSHHGFVEDFRVWRFSSYQELLEEGETFLCRDVVMDWFGGKENFIQEHLDYPYKTNDQQWMIEYR